MTTYCDPEEFEGAYSATSVRILPTSRAPFRASATKVELNDIWLHGVLESSAHINFAEHKMDRAFIRFLRTPGPGLIMERVELPPDAVAVERSTGVF